MRSMGPVWALALTLDRNLLLLVCAMNLLVAALFGRIAFRERRGLEAVLLVVGVYAVLTLVSLAGLHLFARTPLREVTFFSVD